MDRHESHATHRAAATAVPARQRMQLRYGFNEIDGWWHISQGPHREALGRRLRLMGTQVIRVFLYDHAGPDPAKDWRAFVALIDAILEIGATPMVTFAKFQPPYDSARNIREFVARCNEVVWGCVEQWGGEKVRGWYWCIWNEPNNLIVGGNLSFAQYRQIYQEVAASILDHLKPHLGINKARIGGPAIDGTHRAYWMDWIAHLVSEVDGGMIGFVSWHCYGDWRPAVPSATLALEMWGSPDAPSGELFEALLMAQTPSYEARARGVARLLKGRDILNVCGELNTISHHEHYYTLGLNQDAFGAAYYVSALIHLLRGGAELEMRWTATAHADAYGLMNSEGAPTPACLAKQLFAQHVRQGDWLRFPAHRANAPEIDAVIAWDERERCSAVFVNTAGRPRTLTLADWDATLADCRTTLRIGQDTDGRVIVEPFDGTLRLGGYGIAVVTDDATHTVVD